MAILKMVSDCNNDNDNDKHIMDDGPPLLPAYALAYLSERTSECVSKPSGEQLGRAPCPYLWCLQVLAAGREPTETTPERDRPLLDLFGIGNASTYV